MEAAKCGQAANSIFICWQQDHSHSEWQTQHTHQYVEHMEVDCDQVADWVHQVGLSTVQHKNSQVAAEAQHKLQHQHSGQRHLKAQRVGRAPALLHAHLTPSIQQAYPLAITGLQEVTIAFGLHWRRGSPLHIATEAGVPDHVPFFSGSKETAMEEMWLYLRKIKRTDMEEKRKRDREWSSSSAVSLLKNNAAQQVQVKLVKFHKRGEATSWSYEGGESDLGSRAESWGAVQAAADDPWCLAGLNSETTTCFIQTVVTTQGGCGAGCVSGCTWIYL